TRWGAESAVRARQGLAAVGLAIEKQAKINASNGSHRYWTPTPATPGLGPARISGTLVRSITHTNPMPTATFGWEMKIGLAAGMYPTYRGRGRTFTSKTPSSQYGKYLEEGLPNGARYPFLSTAASFGIGHVAAVVAFSAAFSVWTS
ncbi:MAG TPA: hypothetical protein VGC80_10715, partial [Acetobacteraceae bacterium]